MEPGESGLGGEGGRVEPSVTVRFWAGARAAVGSGQEEYAAPATLAELRRAVLERHPDPQVGRVIGACSVLVDGGQPSGPGALIEAGSVVEFLPPFAGG